MPKWDPKFAMGLIPKYVLRLNHTVSLLLLNIPLSMSRWKVKSIPLVPSMALRLVNTPEWEKTDTSTVETVACGSALLPPELNAKIASKVKRTVTQGYGLSECVRVPPFASAISGGIHILVISCRPSRLPQRCKRIASLDTNRSIARSVSSRPACRLGSFVRMVPTVASGNPVSFGPRETGSLEGTSMTKRPLRGHSPRTGGSRLGISSPLTRREISSEIHCGYFCLTFVDLTRSDI